MSSRMSYRNEKQLYAEKLPKFLIGTTLSAKYAIPIFSWFCRIMSIVMIALFIDLILTYGFTMFSMEILLIGASTTLLWFSEIKGGKERKSAKPIRIFEDGIEIYASFYHRLKGFDGFIPVEGIDSIHVERRDSFQLVEGGGMIRLFWAPLELKIKMKDGTEYLTGLKPPSEIMAMVQILKERMNFPVIDTGEGLGRTEPLVQR